jgi:hypothetical protein
MGLDAFRKYQKDKRREMKKSAHEAPAVREVPFRLPQDARAIEFEELLRKRQAQEHIVPVDPDEED